MGGGDGNVFSLAGPTHLHAIDWSNERHRRSVAATLVRACYVLEYDRRNNRHEPEALAPRWWKFFHFQPILKILNKDEKSTIFGAIFQYNPPSEGCEHTKAHNTPKYVIAFRGTILGFRDIKLDLKTILNLLQGTTRTVIAFERVRDFVAKHGSANIWIAGHSLGSSIGMYVGKRMAMDHNVLLETYLFNPPCISASLEWIKSTRIKRQAYEARCLTRAAVAKVLEKNRKKTDESFDRLSTWVPSLFVHAADPICSGYISYFEEREELLKTKFGRHFQRRSMKVSAKALISNFVYSKVRKDLNEPVPLHILPSASVTTNLSHSDSPHKLDQWWKTVLDLQSTIYKFDSESM